MKRLITLIASLALMAIPATAAAATSHGIVLSASSKPHRLQVVDARHVVRGYRYRGALPRVGVGSHVSFRATGATITKLTSSGDRARRISFLGSVLRSSSLTTILRLGDGETMSVATHRAAGVRLITAEKSRDRIPVAVAALTPGSLDPGLVVLVTETLAKGATSVSIKPASASSAGVRGERTVTGVIASAGPRSITIATSAGGVSLEISPAQLAAAGLQACTVVVVTYHQHAAELIADKVRTHGTSTSGSCSGQAGGDGSGSTGSGGDTSGSGSADGSDVVGTVTTISSSGLTVSVPGHGAMSFIVDDPSITNDFIVGDQVDVTYSQQSNGALDASDVEYEENDAAGTVLAVSDSSITIQDSTSGAHETFTADPSQGNFAGVNDGDTVDVTYHLSSGQPVVDQVNDQGNAQGGN